VAVEAPKDSGSVSLAALIPLVLILMTITGAVYPAIDLTAGERERGTLEVLVAAPVPRLSLLIAKYVAVLTVAVLTALINLTVMTATLLITGLGPMIFGPGGLSLLVMAEVFGLLLLFAAFFAAVLLALTSFARSFKEAQAYLIPLMLVSLVPGLLALLPGLKLEGTLTVAPLLNIVLLGRDLLEGQAHLTAAAVVVVSTFLYALAALALAARIFGAEAVLYSESGGWLSLFRRG
jgi:ABC-2 type transport system permease protein/sodium transport system permease protein